MKASQVLLYLEHALGGPVDSDLGGGVMVMNLAGRYLVSMHRWLCMRNVDGLANFVADQQWCALPDDFGSMVAVRRATQLGIATQPVSFEAMLDLRQRTVALSGVVYYQLEADSAQASGYRLGIAQAASSAEADALAFIYDAAWTDIEEENDDVPTPKLMDGILLEVVREYALGLDKKDLNERLARIQGSPIFRAAAVADGRTMARVERVRGTGDWTEWMNDAVVE